MELYFSKEFYTNYLINKCKKVLVYSWLLNLLWFTLCSILVFVLKYQFAGTLEVITMAVVIITVFYIVLNHFEFKRLKCVFFGTLSKEELDEIHKTLFNEFYVKMLINRFAEVMVAYTSISTLLTILFSL